MPLKPSIFVTQLYSNLWRAIGVKRTTLNTILQYERIVNNTHFQIFMSRWGAGGTDGTDPHNRFTREPDDGPKKYDCFFCNEIFEMSELAEATVSNTPEELWSKYEEPYGKYICRGCRGLGSRYEERKKLRKKQEAEGKKQEAERKKQEAERNKQEAERNKQEAERAKKKREEDFSRALRSSSNRSLFERVRETEEDVAQMLLLDTKLDGDDLLSYLIRSKNQSMKNYQLENDHLIREIQCKSGRIMCLLSMSPEDFSRNISSEDFEEILTSPLYSLILSSDQIKFTISKSNEFELLIRKTIDGIPSDSGDYLRSISAKFRRTLGMDNSDLGLYSYYTLENMSIQSWDYFNERSLELAGDMIKAKWSSKIADYDREPMRLMERGVWKQYKSLTNSSKPQRDPFRISRCITDFDYSFSDEVKQALDAMFKSS